MFRKLGYEIKKYKAYFVHIYLLSFLTLLPQFIAAPPLHESKRLVLLVALYFILVFIGKYNKYFYALIIIYLNIASIIIFHTYIHWGYNGGLRMTAIIESPPDEMKEYLATHLNYVDLLQVTYTVVLLFYLYRILKHYRNDYKYIKFIGLIIATTLLFGLSMVKNPFKVDPLGIPWEYYKAKQYLVYPKVRTEYLRKNLLKEKATYQGPYDVIVIIQGESANKHHLSLYGYYKKTSPFFDSMKKNDNFFIFDAIAPANQTRLSVPLINTPATVENFMDPFMKNRSIIGDLSVYGFKTYWLSSQRSYGLTNATIGSIGDEADYRFYGNLEGGKGTDELLIKHLKQIDMSGKIGIFFHLIGSHFKYGKRYTNSHSLIKNPQDTVDDYDNSIYYTDYIIKEIFDYLKTKNKKFLLVYMSDHGEVVNNYNAGHGFTPPFKEEYDVPFIIYSSVDNERIDKLVNRSKKKLINLESLYYIVEYISGIRDDLNISFSTKVNCLEPENIYDYYKLKYSKASN